MRHLPFGIAGERHVLPLLVLAPIVDFARDHRVIAVDMRGHGEAIKVEHG
jgi:pimeloyl-ACP methyl ester carboxylesterase